METTTIQISNTLMEILRRMKFYEKESYEEVIWDLMEDTQELNAETKQEIEQARAEIKAGKFKTLAEVKKELNL